MTTLLVFLISKFCFCQITSSSSDSLNKSHKDFSDEIILKKGNLAIEISASALPKAKITRDRGNYRLQSHLQSAFDIGLNYLYNVNKSLLISSGFHVNIGKWNFFANIPSEDLSRYNVSGRSIIWSKDIWGAMRIPVLIEKKINTKKAGLVSIKTGINFRYSGFMTDLVMSGGGIIDSSNQGTSIFSAFFSGKNDSKPWITFSAEASKLFILDNLNVLSVGLQVDISTTYFFKGNYTITIPDKPVTSGTYNISGTSLGLSVQYIFTSSNKRLIREYEKKKAF